jgi:pyruvate ferredoxin oxidoreductase gamma subunit
MAVKAKSSKGKKPKLTKKNQFGFFEVRMESIGGLGANVGGKILAEAVVFGMGFNASSFASYGSEKKGTPVKAFVRIAEPKTEIRVNSPIEEPHILAIFHESMVRTLPVTAGLLPDGAVILNTKKSAEQARDFMRISSGTVGAVDATEIAIQTKSRANMVLLGAIARASGFIELKALNEAVKAAFGARYPAAMPGNLAALERGFKEVEMKTFQDDGKFKHVPSVRTLPELGYENAPMGGVIYAVGNTSLKDLSASRIGFIPLFIEDKCTKCGDCDMYCPDYCYVWERDIDKKTGKEGMILKGIDYQYCKGCLRCTKACRFGAIEPVKESDYNIDDIIVKHKFSR